MQAQHDDTCKNIFSMLQYNKTEYKKEMDSFETHLNTLLGSGLENMLTQMDDKLQTFTKNIRDTNVELGKLITQPNAQNSSLLNKQDLHNQLFNALSRTFNQRFESIERNKYFEKMSSSGTSKPTAW